MIHCSITLRDVSGTYHKYPYLTLLSCFENTSARLHIHLLSDETLEPHKPLFEALCDRFGHALTVHSVPSFPPDCARMLPPNWGPATAYWFFLPDLVPAERVIHLDSDLIFERDISELGLVDTGDAFCAAVIDPVRRKYPHLESYWKRLGICTRRYCNSGVMVLNLAKIRAESSENLFWAMCRRLIPRCPLPYLKFADQDVLNALFTPREGDFFFLDEALNYTLGADSRLFDSLRELQGKIVHLTGEKPLGVFYPAHLVFWKYYARSPWGKTLFEDLACCRGSMSDMELLRFVWNHPTWPRRVKDFTELGIRGYLLKRLCGRRKKRVFSA